MDELNALRGACDCERETAASVKCYMLMGCGPAGVAAFSTY